MKLWVLCGYVSLCIVVVAASDVSRTSISKLVVGTQGKAKEDYDRDDFNGGYGPLGTLVANDPHEGGLHKVRPKRNSDSSKKTKPPRRTGGYSLIARPQKQEPTDVKMRRSRDTTTARPKYSGRYSLLLAPPTLQQKARIKRQDKASKKKREKCTGCFSALVRQEKKDEKFVLQKARTKREHVFTGKASRKCDDCDTALSAKNDEMVSQPSRRGRHHKDRRRGKIHHTAEPDRFRAGKYSPMSLRPDSGRIMSIPANGSSAQENRRSERKKGRRLHKERHHGKNRHVGRHSEPPEDIDKEIQERLQ
ncbi:uncharacterized protein LOC134609247 isoform X1 [Pelobates fuscus]|uniref:uncharacterized protein LOC134609247 isoform X1 n=1 Tax=Pelobates fuscus TaxID=191477 RepID=UPI002FE446A9